MKNCLHIILDASFCRIYRIFNKHICVFKSAIFLSLWNNITIAIISYPKYYNIGIMFVCYISLDEHDANYFPALS